jgi:hypothetical protein
MVMLRSCCDGFRRLGIGGVGFVKLVSEFGEVPGDGGRVGEAAPAA